jgi:TetR/AcrR family transcriptional repressor of bet genes
MPKIGMEDFRRKTLIAATLKTIQEKGTIDVRVSDIAKNANVSSALAHHYFGSKDQMILAALRHLLSEFQSTALHELHQANTPQEKLMTLIEVCLADDQFLDENVSAWLIFYAHSQNSLQARKLLQVYVRRLQSNLRFYLRPICGDKTVEVAETVGSLIDGIFIRQALRLEKADAQYARKLVKSCIQPYLLMD